MIDKTEFVITSQNFNLCLNCPAYEAKDKLYVFCIINAALQCMFTEQMLIEIKNGTIRQTINLTGNNMKFSSQTFLVQ